MLFITELGTVGKVETFLHLADSGITDKLIQRSALDVMAGKASSGMNLQDNHSADLGIFKEGWQ